MRTLRRSPVTRARLLPPGGPLPWGARAGWRGGGLGGFGLLVVLGCNGLTDLGGTQQLPAGVQDPAMFSTAAGALAMYRVLVADFEHVVPGVAAAAGVLTDELQDGQYGGSALLGLGGFGYTLDVRQIPENGSDGMVSAVYAGLHGVRREAVQAIGALAKYDSARHPALMGEAYALEAYAEVLLADLYCSGIPLSRLEFEGDFVYRPGSTTQEVYHHAITLFDSALALAGDSARILNVARVGKGRALLDLGDFAGAAASVAAVPDTFHQQVAVFWDPTPGKGDLNTWLPQQTSVSDREGVTGQPYRSSGDPRTSAVANGTNSNGQRVYFPAKYGHPGSTTPVVLASGVEARLIQAEAALQHGDASWLTLLNALRTDGTSVPLPADTIADTLGVTGCAPGVRCGAGPGGHTPDFGQPTGGFPVPAGYSFAYADTTYPAPAGVQDFCNAHSWYNPCWAGDSMVVYHYVRPASVRWNAGAGGVAGLAPLADPGSVEARLDTLFTERAAWLFVTGTRQGDLRRLIRLYGRPQQAVYPSGMYFGRGGQYGADVTISIPATERYNPLFTGCFDRGA